MREPGIGPENADVERVAAALKARRWRGSASTEASRPRPAAGSRPPRTAGRAFVKIGWTLDTASWIRDEYLFYARMRGVPFLPTFVGWADDGERPVLALEDLSGAAWPPPWDPRRVEQAIACLEEVAAATPPPDLPTARSSQWSLNGWPEVARDPSPFLSLGLCSRA
jgi:hypothetical protein